MSEPTFEAHTTVIIDMSLPGMPIQTSGLKILDAHVNADNQLFVLLDPNAGSGNL